MVLMGVEIICVVKRQGSGCSWRVVLVRLAGLCWRSVVSWRRFPLVPWRHSFSSRMLLRVVDRAPHDGRIAEHGDCVGELAGLPGELLHGRQQQRQRQRQVRQRAIGVWGGGQRGCVSAREPRQLSCARWGGRGDGEMGCGQRQRE